MSGFTFKPAVQTQGKARVALVGPAGSGKTYTMLAVATALGKRVAVIDTEHGSASKYAGQFPFDSLELTEFSPKTYTDAIKAAGAAGYDVLGIDSLSHAWMGTGGALELVDIATARDRNHNSYTAWREVTPLQNALIEAILQSPCHIIATMRAKTEYVMEKDERTGKTAPRKIGMAPIQRDNVDYEFDVVGELDNENTLVITKSRCPTLSGTVIKKPGKALAADLLAWLSDGAVAPAKQPAQPKGTDAETKQAAATVAKAVDAIRTASPELLDAAVTQVRSELGSPTQPREANGVALASPKDLSDFGRLMELARQWPEIDLAPYEVGPQTSAAELKTLGASLKQKCETARDTRAQQPAPA